MKLYGAPHSPFVARVRLAMRAKSISCEMERPPGGGTGSPEHLALNPMGKIPVLITDDGTAIAESETIIDYLDEQFPSPPLMPADAASRARVRNIIRTFELYVTPALFRLFRQLDPSKRDAAAVANELQQWDNGLTLTDHFVDDAMYAVGGTLSKADCVLLPSLLLCERIATIFEQGDLVAAHANLNGYREKAKKHPDMAATWNETAAALQALRPVSA